MSKLLAEPRNVLFVGSSTTAGTGPSSPDKVYTNIVAQARPNDTVTVRAEGGTLVNDWLSIGVAQGNALNNSYIILTDAIAAQFVVGDYIQLYTSAGVLKEQKAFTITSMPSASGFTNVTFSPNAAVATVTGDIVKLAFSLTQQDVGIVQLGVNDWYVPVDTSTFKTQVISLLTNIRAQSPAIQLFWLRTWMPNSVDAARIAQWNEYEIALREAVAMPGPNPCIFLDMRETNRSLYWMDPTGFHYNDFGHRLLAKKVLEYL